MPRVALNLPDARKILLVKELDRTDPDGRLLSTEDKRSATIRCCDGWDPDGDPGRGGARIDGPALGLLKRRSLDVLHLLAKGNPEVLRLADWRRESMCWTPVLFAVAIIVGFLSARLGSGSELNLMALPLLVILAWNGLIVVAAIASWFNPGRQPGQGGPWAIDFWLAALGARRRGAGGPEPDSQVSQESEIKREWLSRFRESERKLLRPWRRSRVAAALHTAAAIFAVAGIAGLYHRGWAVEYRAVWESTLLGSDGARAFFGSLFRPAATLFQLDLPLHELPQMRAGPGRAVEPSPALPWIHLYAATLALFAVLPRSLLAVTELMRARHAFHRAVVPPDITSYLGQLTREVSGGASVIVVIPYGFDPEPRRRDEVRALLHQLRGGRVCIQYRGPVRYGDEETCIYFDGEEAGATVLLMNMASTPEDETHGFLIRGLRERRLMAGGGGLMVLVDAAPFVDRMRDLPEFENRLGQRRQVWSETIERAGLAPVFLNLPDQSNPEVLESMEQGWWEASRSSSTSP